MMYDALGGKWDVGSSEKEELPRNFVRRLVWDVMGGIRKVEAEVEVFN
jgi:hypothetical protein